MSSLYLVPSSIYRLYVYVVTSLRRVNKTRMRTGRLELLAPSPD